MAIPPNQHQMEKSIKIHLACFKPKKQCWEKDLKETLSIQSHGKRNQG